MYNLNIFYEYNWNSILLHVFFLIICFLINDCHSLLSSQIPDGIPGFINFIVICNVKHDSL